MLPDIEGYFVMNAQGPGGSPIDMMFILPAFGLEGEHAMKIKPRMQSVFYSRHYCIL